MLLWALGRRKRFRVQGESMRPTLVPGDSVLVDTRAFRQSGPSAGDVVVSRHPFRSDLVLIKRVASLTDGAVVLRGDNPEQSTDSASLGAVPLHKLMGKVVLCVTEAGLKPPAAKR